jgi:hypothetical protein
MLLDLASRAENWDSVYNMYFIRAQNFETSYSCSSSGNALGFTSQSLIEPSCIRNNGDRKSCLFPVAMTFHLYRQWYAS